MKKTVAGMMNARLARTRDWNSAVRSMAVQSGVDSRDMRRECSRKRADDSRLRGRDGLIVVEMFLLDLFLEGGLVAALRVLLLLDRLPGGLAQAARPDRDREAGDEPFELGRRAGGAGWLGRRTHERLELL